MPAAEASAATGHPLGPDRLLGKSHQLGGDGIDRDRIVARQQGADMDRIAAARSVSFHACDGVDDGQSGTDLFGQLQQHEGEEGLVGARLQVEPRLAHADHRAEKVLNPAGKAHHLMGLELGKVEDDVGLEDLPGQLQLVKGSSRSANPGRLLEGGEGGPRLFGDRQNAAPFGDLAGRTDSGRVSHGDLSARLLGQADHGSDDLRMGGDRLFGTLARQHVGFDQNLLSRLDKGAHAAQRREEGGEAPFDRVPPIVGEALQGDPGFHPGIT